MSPGGRLKTRVPIAGATGLAGRAVCAALTAHPIEVVPLSRAHGVDLLSGEGLERLTGCDLLIDTSNVTAGSLSREIATVRAAERLIQAACDYRVGRIAILSILGIDHPGFNEFAYYQAKREQERLARSAPLESAIVRSSQWFEFVMNPAATALHDHQVEVADWLIQPAAVSTVGKALAEVALASTTGIVSIAGPEPICLPELTKRFLAARGDRRKVIEIPPRLPAFGSGALLANSQTTLLEPTLTDWLEETRASEL
ncbi:SDR family oxidoreductase [Psychromicrobium lacuslunae]|uniref:NAD(P)-binding domain-containing protein n=1 Tax=Psychromicrobium lacuslunae TaxID=1618207 RepID=A0A0D4BZQ8_9MICC|nr:hypothetical protein [Psychromicrobium lacuslunae]AJT41799.1 hypothetical protein UM93_10200 [Psychromicrobium lacuslunae]